MKFIHVASYKDEFFNGIKSVLQELVPEQRKLGHDVYVFNHERNLKVIIPGEQFISSRKDFVDAVDTIKPDFVVFHSLYYLSNVMCSWYLCKQGIPYYVEPHGGTSIENAKKNWLKKKIANILFANNFISNAAGIIYLNEKEQDECVFKKIRKDFAIIPNGTRFHLMNKIAPPSDKIHFMFLARIDIIQKGLDLLFPAIEEFNNRGYKDKVEFHFYGKARNPQYTQEFEQYVAQASDNVFFHGPVIGHKKDEAFSNADIFLLPSRYEGMPMAVLEALSYGCPCILTPQTNMADIIDKHNAGWITETNINSIVDTLQDAYNDYNSKRNEYITNAFDAVKAYSWEAIAKKSIEEYVKLLQKE